jgi:hypothetical protein
VSGFVHNIARRGAGLEPVAPVRPPFVPNFAPALPTRVWRSPPNLVEVVRETREQPPPTTGLRPSALEPDREAGQEQRPTRSSAPAQVSSPAPPPLPAHDVHTPDPEPPDLPAPARRTDAQPPAQGSAAPRSPAGPTDPSRVFSSSQEGQERSAPTIWVNKARQTKEGSASSPADDLSPGPQTGPSPELRAASEPGRAPGTQSPPPGSAGPPRPRVRSSEEVPEQRAPDVRTPTVGQMPGGPTAVVSETGEPDSPVWRGEIATDVEPERAPFRLGQPPSGERAAAVQPALPSPARVTPTPVASPVASSAAGRQAAVVGSEPVWRAAVIRPEQAQQAVPTLLLQRPAARPEPIHVRIGTVEVRATTPPPAPPSAPASQGFDDYASIRTYADWGWR